MVHLYVSHSRHTHEKLTKIIFLKNNKNLP